MGLCSACLAAVTLGQSQGLVQVTGLQGNLTPRCLLGALLRGWQVPPESHFSVINMAKPWPVLICVMPGWELCLHLQKDRPESSLGPGLGLLPG